MTTPRARAYEPEEDIALRIIKKMSEVITDFTAEEFETLILAEFPTAKIKDIRRVVQILEATETHEGTIQ